jgi:hypothetical protein
LIADFKRLGRWIRRSAINNIHIDLPVLVDPKMHVDQDHDLLIPSNLTLKRKGEECPTEWLAQSPRTSRGKERADMKFPSALPEGIESFTILLGFLLLCRGDFLLLDLQF